MRDFQRFEESERLNEMCKFTIERMQNSNSSAISLYGMAKKLKLKELVDKFAHRNAKKLKDIARSRKVDEVKKRFSSLIKGKQLEDLVADRENAKDWYDHLTNYSDNTELGAIHMAYESWAQISQEQMSRSGKWASTKQIFRQRRSLCSNFVHGHFGFCKPEGQGSSVTHVVHHATGLLGKLPLKIAQDDIGTHAYRLSKWSSLHDCTVKGPSNFSVSVKQLFSDKDQKKIIRDAEIPLRSMLNTKRERELALRPANDHCPVPVLRSANSDDLFGSESETDGDAADDKKEKDAETDGDAAVSDQEMHPLEMVSARARKMRENLEDDAVAAAVATEEADRLEELEAKMARLKQKRKAQRKKAEFGHSETDEADDGNDNGSKEIARRKKPVAEASETEESDDGKVIDAADAFVRASRCPPMNWSGKTRRKKPAAQQPVALEERRKKPAAKTPAEAREERRKKPAAKTPAEAREERRLSSKSAAFHSFQIPEDIMRELETSASETDFFEESDDGKVAPKGKARARGQKKAPCKKPVKIESTDESDDGKVGPEDKARARGPKKAPHDEPLVKIFANSAGAKSDDETHAEADANSHGAKSDDEAVADGAKSDDDGAKSDGEKPAEAAANSNGAKSDDDGAKSDGEKPAEAAANSNGAKSDDEKPAEAAKSDDEAVADGAASDEPVSKTIAKSSDGAAKSCDESASEDDDFKTPVKPLKRRKILSPAQVTAALAAKSKPAEVESKPAEVDDFAEASDPLAAAATKVVFA